MIFPNIKAKETDKLELNSLKEIGWDFEKDEPLFKDNNFVVVEGIEALKVWVYKTIKTTRFKYLIYSRRLTRKSSKILSRDSGQTLLILDDFCISRRSDDFQVSRLEYKFYFPIANLT